MNREELKDFSSDELEAELKKREDAKFDTKKIMELSDHTDEDKIETFDRIYANAREIFDGKLSGKIHEDSDDEHYLVENVMQWMLGTKVYDIMNKYL